MSFLSFHFDLQKKTKRKGLIYTCFGTIVQYGLRQLARRNREPVIMQSRSINIMSFWPAIRTNNPSFYFSHTKKFKQYNSYRSEGIINAADFYITINGGRIRYSLLAPTLPYIVLSVLPFGDLAFAFDKESGKVNSFHQYRDAVTTAKAVPCRPIFL